MANLSLPPPEHRTDPAFVDAHARAADGALPGARVVQLLARAPEHGMLMLRMLDHLHNEGGLPLRLKRLVAALLADLAGDAYTFERCAHVPGPDEDIPVDAVLGDYDTDDRLSDRERLALRYAEQMVLDASKVDEDFYAELRGTFNEAEVMELGTHIAINHGLSVLLASVDRE
jgi:alkylhydroperoxidase family enzyme